MCLWLVQICDGIVKTAIWKICLRRQSWYLQYTWIIMKQQRIRWQNDNLDGWREGEFKRISRVLAPRISSLWICVHKLVLKVIWLESLSWIRFWVLMMRWCAFRKSTLTTRKHCWLTLTFQNNIFRYKSLTSLPLWKRDVFSEYQNWFECDWFGNVTRCLPDIWPPRRLQWGCQNWLHFCWDPSAIVSIADSTQGCCCWGKGVRTGTTVHGAFWAQSHVGGVGWDHGGVILGCSPCWFSCPQSSSWRWFSNCWCCSGHYIAVWFGSGGWDWRCCAV